jgi:hypothetical protein
MGGGQQGGGPHTGGGQTGGAHIGGPHTGGGQMGPPADTWISEPEINIMLTVNAIAIDLILIKSSSKRRGGNVYLTYSLSPRRYHILNKMYFIRHSVPMSMHKSTQY